MRPRPRRMGRAEHPVVALRLRAGTLTWWGDDLGQVEQAQPGAVFLAAYDPGRPAAQVFRRHATTK